MLQSLKGSLKLSLMFLYTYNNDSLSLLWSPIINLTLVSAQFLLSADAHSRGITMELEESRMRPSLISKRQKSELFSLHH